VTLASEVARATPHPKIRLLEATRGVAADAQGTVRALGQLERLAWAGSAPELRAALFRIVEEADGATGLAAGRVAAALRERAPAGDLPVPLAAPPAPLVFAPAERIAAAETRLDA
jgi:hypothetical protein